MKLCVSILSLCVVIFGLMKGIRYFLVCVKMLLVVFMSLIFLEFFIVIIFVLEFLIYVL